MAVARAKAQTRLFWRFAVSAAVIALSGCGPMPDPGGLAMATQDRYDFITCGEIISNRGSQNARVKELTGLIEKAESSQGGFIIGAAAYRSELVQARALAQAAERAARMHNCDAAKK